MISLDRIQDRLTLLGIDAGSVDAIVLQDILGGAVAFVGTLFNRYFGEARPKVEYWPGTGVRKLPLTSAPIIDGSAAVITVTEQSSPGVSVAVLVEGAAEGWELRQGLRHYWLERRGGPVWRFDREYVVEYTEGYEVDGLPADIEELLFWLVTNRYRNLTDTDSGLRSETLGQYSYTRFTEADLSGFAGLDTLMTSWKDPVFA